MVGGSDHAGGSITLNLPRNELLANSARIVISVAILLSNPLQFYVAISIIFPNVISPRVHESHHVVAEYVLRYFIIIVCCKYMLIGITFIVIVLKKIGYKHLETMFNKYILAFSPRRCSNT